MNYTKQDKNIISHQTHDPVYSPYIHNLYQYEEMRPPPFDHVLNMKEAKKREKATLDKHSKKYIFKNIRTCSEFARSQREKINKTLLR